MRLLEKSLTESLYETLKESSSENTFMYEYWATEEDREEGFGDIDYLEASDEDEAVHKLKDLYLKNGWASCEIWRKGINTPEDMGDNYPYFGIYPEEDGGETYLNDKGEPVNESVMVTTGDTFVTSDETGLTIDDNGNTINVSGGATVDVASPVVDEPAEEPIEDVEEPVEEVPAEELPAEVSEEPTEAEEEIIEPSEELIDNEEEEEDLEESAPIDNKVTSEDLNSSGVNYEFSYGDKGDNYLTCFWSSNGVTEEDIPEGDNLDDYGAINFTIYDKDGNEVDGGLMVTKEDSFNAEDLCKDLCGLCGYDPEGFTQIKRMPNGDYAEVFGLEESLKENAGDPNSRVEIYRNPEFDYSILDITELDNTDVGDVRAIDMFSILNDLEESLTEKYGTEKWGLMNTFLTRQGKHKKTNESYASAILDINIPKNGLKEELNTILTVEVFGDKLIKECVVKEARTNKKIERFCGKTPNPVKFLENVFVDLINNRETKDICKYKLMTEDTGLREAVSDEAYMIAEYIERNCQDVLQDGVNGEKILRRDNFDELFAQGCREAFNIKDEDMDNFWSDMEGKAWDLEVDVRSILGYSGFETIFETDESRNAEEGDLVILSNDLEEAVEPLVNEPYEDKGMNFADGKAIDKDVKRQERHLKQHKELGKETKEFKVSEEPDQKNTAGEKVEDIQDTVEVEEDGKKKSPSKKKSSSKKKKVEESMDEEAERIMLNPVKNFDFIDPYGEYYEDENGNLYKSVDNGNELYICTKEGEPLKYVDASKYILSDKALNEKTLEEAKGLLDDEDESEESIESSEDLVDVDDELEEGATEVAIFHRKPKSVEAMRQAEANGVTVNKSNYKVISTKEMSGEEFDKFINNLYPQEYDWLKDLYDSTDNSGMFKCIEVINKDDNAFSILVDPGESASVKYAAIKENLDETQEEEPIEEPVEDTEEEITEE